MENQLIKQQAETAVRELLEASALRAGDILVIGCSSSEIVGETIGVHPFFMLLAAFVGFRLFGIAGVVLIPILLYVGKAAVTEMAREL